jgi:NADH-quinone oxidoreductase subunit N
MLLAAVTKPSIDWAGVSPLIALLGGSIVVLLAGLLRGRFIREQIVPFLTTPRTCSSPRARRARCAPTT